MIKWIYGTKHSTNIRPVIDARRFLEKHGYLKVEKATKDLRSIRLVSQPLPFLPYAVEQLKRIRPRKGAQAISDEEQEALRRILDSNWFRKSFRERMDDWRQKGMATGSLRDVAEYMEEIATITIVFAKAFPNILPTSRDLIHAKNFDQFVESWFNAVLRDRTRLVRIARRVATEYRIRIPYEGEAILIRNTLEHPKLPPLCIPLSLADKMSRVGRIQLTLFTQLFGSLEDALDFHEHEQEVDFQKLASTALSQDMGKFLHNGIVNETTPYATFMIPAEQDELEVAERTGLAITVSWESPGEGIASTLFNDYLSLPKETTEGVSMLVLWAYWTGIRQYVEKPMFGLSEGNLLAVINRNKSFLRNVIAKAEERRDFRQIQGEKAIVRLLDLTEELIMKNNLSDFLRYSLHSRGEVDQLTRTILASHGNYTGAGELLFRNLSLELGERVFDGLIAAGQQEQLRVLLPRHMLEALDVWNGFVNRILGVVEDKTVLSVIHGDFESSREKLRSYSKFVSSLASLARNRRIAVAYLWASKSS